jgi:hypothetical protein
MVNTRWVSAGYFNAMGTALLEGRAIEDSDIEGRPPVVVVNKAFASRYYPGASAVGRRFRIRGLDPSDPPRPWSTIVGVVADVRHSNLEDAPPPQVYSSLYQGEPMDSLYVAVQTRVAPDAMVSTVRRTIRNIDPQLALADIHVMGELVSEATARRRFQTTLLTAFGVIALALAAGGLYGLMSYTVRQRTREIGVRLALGARTSDVLLLVAGHGAKITLLGISIGAGVGVNPLRRRTHRSRSDCCHGCCPDGRGIARMSHARAPCDSLGPCEDAAGGLTRSRASSRRTC